MLHLLIAAIYMSGDELERDEARKHGYLKVVQHPNEIGELEPDQVLVIDFNHVLFDDHELAIAKANEAAQRGVLVGIHTYYREALKLYRLTKLPNVFVADTHQFLLLKLNRYAKLHGPWRKIATAANPKGEVTNDNHDQEGAAGHEASVVSGS